MRGAAETDDRLHALFRDIAAGDVASVSRLLDASPELATAAARVGASRAEPAPYFLERIAHYTYAGDSALHVAAAAHHTSLVRELVARGASVDARNRRGASPLHYACDAGPGTPGWDAAAQAATIHCLLTAGADPNAVDRDGVAPLHRAVRARSAEAARVLLEHGADARRVNGRGSAPLDLARRATGRSGSGSEAARAQQAEILRLLGPTPTPAATIDTPPKRDMANPAKNTICLWYDRDAEEAARFYARTFPDSSVSAVHRAPGDYPSGKQGDVITVDFTVLGIPCIGLNGGPSFRHSEAFSFQIATVDQAETDRYWNAIVGNGGEESQCGWCKDKWGLSWQITPIALTQAITDPDPAAAKRAFDAMMQMRKIDIATIEKARRG